MFVSPLAQQQQLIKTDAPAGSLAELQVLSGSFLHTLTDS